MNRTLDDQSRSRSVLLPLLLILAALLWGCSGAAGTPSIGPTPGGAGSIPAPNPPFTTPPATLARYLYVGNFTNLGGVQGFHIDPTGGTLTEVPGSPIQFGQVSPNQIPEGGVVAAAAGHVFVAFGPPALTPPGVPPVIRSYAIDPATGSLGTFTEVDAGSVSNDVRVHRLVTDPAGRNLYVVYQNNIASFRINTDGSLTSLGTISGLATAFIFSLVIHPTANIAFLGVDNCPPKGFCGGPPDILLLDRDPSTGALSNTERRLGVPDVLSPSRPALDPAGEFLFVPMVDTSGNSEIGVFRVDAAAGTLTQAVGSPYPVPDGLFPTAFGFDSSVNHMYAVEGSQASPNPESLAVYEFTPSTGVLTLLQNQQLPSGAIPTELVADDDFIFVVSSQVGPTPSQIITLSRSASNGTVSGPQQTLIDPVGRLGQAVEVRF